MNYYEHHLGDYAEATAHLSFVEDAAYSRLMRKYYATERALPGEVAAVQRLVGARSKEEREAVAAVLAEFFDLRDGAHHNARCETEIARFQDKQRKAKASADARWAHTGRNANASPDAMRTHSEGNAPRARSSPQSPDTREEIPPATRAPPSAEASGDDRPMTAKDLVVEGVDAKVARDWLKVRKAKKAPLTQTAWDGIKREADIAGITPAEAVKHAAEQSWQSFKASWLKRDAGGAANGQTLSFRERDADLAAARVHAMTGGLVSAKPARAQLEIVDAETSARLG